MALQPRSHAPQFNLVWFFVSIVIIGNIFLFTFLSKNVTKYVSDIESQRADRYSSIFDE